MKSSKDRNVKSVPSGKRLVITSIDSSEKVKVIVRCRPMSKKERRDNYDNVVLVKRNTGEVVVSRPKSLESNSSSVEQHKAFTYDAVYDGSVTQSELFDETFRPLIDSVLEGFNGTIFAYCQTGTGKTYTMEGLRDVEIEQGVIPLACKQIFDAVEKNPNKQYLVRASYLEIYQEDILDLLSKKKQHRELKESTTGGVFAKDLSTFLCSNFNEINELMTRGNKNRAVGATNMNERSSRSHAIFQITVEVSEEWPDGQNHIKVGKLNLVDLAGSERQGKSGATGERLKEATKINLSLSALGNVIAALVDGKCTHVPYRDSKLTRLLQDSLGGNSRTIMVATIGPASFNWEETMTTLRYASRAKRIKNKPVVNEDPKDAMLRQYQEEIARLRQELLKRREKHRTEFPGDEDPQTPRTSRRAQTASNVHDQMRLMEEQRMKELAPFLAPYGLDPSSDLKHIMSQLEKRRQALLKDNQTVKSEKDQLLSKLEETKNLVQSAEEECMKLAERIRWLESKVLTGGKSLLDRTNEQQRLIEEKQKELDEQNRRFEMVQKQVEEHELTTGELRITLSDLEHENRVKTKNCNKLTHKLRSAREEIVRITEQNASNRTEIQEVYHELKKEIALKKLIIENFIPHASRKAVEPRIQWDDAIDNFRVVPHNETFLKRPKCNRMLATPLYSLRQLGPVHPTLNVHYEDENILQLSPEKPTERRTNYVPPKMDPFIKSLIKRAHMDAEADVFIDCSSIPSTRKRYSTSAKHKMRK